MAGVVEAIIEVGRQRNSLLMELKAALQSDQQQQALEIARKLVGLSDETSNRVNPRLN